MRASDLEAALDRLAPWALAEAGDNCGLLVGDHQASVRRILAALELTESVLEEALGGGYDTILTHHPLLYSPVRRLVESQLRERLIRGLIAGRVTLLACHTNLDAAPGGLADIAGEALGLQRMTPLRLAGASWFKFVGFIPEGALEAVAAAVFSAGAGGIGDYRDCAFSGEGRGWFTPLPGSHPAIGEVWEPERTPEIRWETVVPKGDLAKAISAYLGAHPYEEPAFDVYPVEDVLIHAGIGRGGALPEPVSLPTLAARVQETFGLAGVRWSGDPRKPLSRVGIVPGSGRSLLESAAESCDALITGDLGYHDAERALELGLCLVDVPHGDLEWWTFRRWAETLGRELAGRSVALVLSRAWQSPWWRNTTATEPVMAAEARLEGGSRMRLWIDGGSRGNPGPSAIGVVLEDESGSQVDSACQVIGIATNNVAEYRALISGLEMAERAGARSIEVRSDSELLVRQIRGQYRVKNEGLKPLYEEAVRRAHTFDSFSIRHVSREENARADALVNHALDESAPASSDHAL